jgi:hypothetical protein
VPSSAHHHLQVAVAGEGDDAAFGAGDPGGDPGGQPVAHRARLRRDEPLAPAEAQCLFGQIAKLPAPLVTMASSGRSPASVSITARMSSARRLGQRRSAASKAAPASRRARRPSASAPSSGPIPQRMPSGDRGGVDRQVGGVDLVELTVRGMGVDQHLPPSSAPEERVAVGRVLAEADVEREEEVARRSAP